MGNFDILGPVHKDPILVRQIAKMQGKLHFWPFLAILAHIIDCISISQCQTDIHLDLSEWHGWWQGQMRPFHLNLALDRPKKCQNTILGAKFVQKFQFLSFLCIKWTKYGCIWSVRYLWTHIRWKMCHFKCFWLKWGVKIGQKCHFWCQIGPQMIF